MPPGRGPHAEPPQNSLERREAQRVEILGALRADVLISQTIQIADISDLGLQVIAEFPFQLNSIHEFRLSLDGTTVVVKGRIVHASVVDLDGEGVRYKSGVAFEDLAAPTRAVIAEFARRLPALRAGDRATSG